jgi:hypothetical protein
MTVRNRTAASYSVSPDCPHQDEDCGMARCSFCVGAHNERVLEENARVVCENEGHEWVEAGGGYVVCARCEAEKWSTRS